MPISELPKNYHPSQKETEIVRCLTQSEKGLTYTEIKKQTGLSDTGLTKLLKRLHHFDLIINDRRGKYLVTVLGMRYLMGLKIMTIPQDTIRAKRTKARTVLWDQVHQLHEKIVHNPGDAWSEPFKNSVPSDVWWVAAYQRDGKKWLSFRSATLEELQKLGKSSKSDNPEEKLPKGYEWRTLSDDEIKKLAAAGGEK